MEGQESISSVAGPISGSLSGIKLFFKTILDHKPWNKDPIALRKPWDEDSYRLVEHGKGSKLCFAFLWDDGCYLPTPPIWRAMEIAKKALIRHGHEVIDWDPILTEEMWKIGKGGIWSAGAQQDFKATLAPTGEPLITSMLPPESTFPVPDLPPIIRGDGCDAYELWQLHKRKRDIRGAYLDHWQATVSKTGTGRPVDAIISPAAPYPAPPHGLYRVALYTTVFNILDFPAAVVPVTKVDPSLDTKKPPHKFRNEEDRVIYEISAPENFKDAPVSLQVVGRTQEDEAVIALAEIVDKAIREYSSQQSTTN